MPGSRIVVDADGQLVVPARPIVPVVAGVGASALATAAALEQVDAAVARAYGAGRSLHWLRFDAGEASMRTLRTPVPDATIQAIRVHRVALLGALPQVDGDARTLEAELVELLDLYLGSCRLGPDAATRLCWESRETSAAGLALEEGGSDAAQVQQALDEVQGHIGPRGSAPGWAVSVISRQGTQRFTAAALAGRTSLEVMVLHEPTEAPAFVGWVKAAAQATNTPVETLSLTTAITRLLSGRPLPHLVLSSATLAAQWLAVATARPGAPLSRELAHPETGHALFLPLRDDLPEGLMASAMRDASALLLRRLGWAEAADELEGVRRAKAS